MRENFTKINETYMDWLIQTLKDNNNVIADEYMYYKREFDSKDVDLIHVLGYGVYKYARDNFIGTTELITEDDCFTQYAVILKYKEMFIHIEELNGQGSITYVNLLEDYKGNEYVDWEKLSKGVVSNRAIVVKETMDEHLGSHIEAIKVFAKSDTFKDLKRAIKTIDDRFISRYIIDSIVDIVTEKKNEDVEESEEA